MIWCGPGRHEKEQCCGYNYNVKRGPLALGSAPLQEVQATPDFASARYRLDQTFSLFRKGSNAGWKQLHCHTRSDLQRKAVIHQANVNYRK